MAITALLRQRLLEKPLRYKKGVEQFTYFLQRLETQNAVTRETFYSGSYN